MRRLLVLVCAMAMVETLLYSALAPLLPVFKAQLGFSKGQAGLLVAMYAVGEGLAALPVGLLASRVGVKRSALTGLVMLAATSVAFGLVDNYGELLVTRFLQGVAGVICWVSGIAWLVDAAPRQRRGEVIGIFSGAAAAGAVCGPLVGGVGALVGRAEAFIGVAACALLLAAVALQLPRPVVGRRQSLAHIWKAHRSRQAGRRPVVRRAAGAVARDDRCAGASSTAPSRLGGGRDCRHLPRCGGVGVLARPLVARWAERRGRLHAIRLSLARLHRGNARDSVVGEAMARLRSSSCAR